MQASRAEYAALAARLQDSRRPRDAAQPAAGTALANAKGVPGLADAIAVPDPLTDSDSPGYRSEGGGGDKGVGQL